MNRQERIELVNEAIELVSMAQSLVEEAMSGALNTAHFDAYGKYGFDQLLGNGNRYDSSLQHIIDELNEEVEDEDEYEDEE